jgi:predicted transposase/invertase (TIGR01784 family)
VKSITFAPDDDLINPGWDTVFKAVFTKQTETSQGALRGLLSAILERTVTVVKVKANEPAVDDLRDRQIRYDISCKFDAGELADVEMTLNPDKCEPVRIEYYTSKLFIGQDIRGNDRNYDNLKGTYQISLLVNGELFEDEKFLHEFQSYDEVRKTPLGGRTHIITLELSKIEGLLKKPVEEMSAKERWAVFFKYCTDKGNRGVINEILKQEEGIAMAGAELLTISKDEHEQARLLSELKYELDLQSRVVTAKREGLAEGWQKGQREGWQKGQREGQRKILDLLRNGRTLEDILKEYGDVESGATDDQPRRT